MSSDIEFVDGLTFKAPPERAPDFVKASGGMERERLIAFLQSRTEKWVNFDVKESRGGKWYAAVNAYKPDGERQQRQQPKPAPQPEATGFEDDDIPF